MPAEMHKQTSDFIAVKILKQPKRIIKADEVLIFGGVIDSFTLVDLALFVEDTFDARAEDSGLNTNIFDSIKKLSALIVAR